MAILAGGLASRLGQITRDVPKALVEVAGRPFIDHQLGLLACNGVRRVVLCVGHLGEQIADHVGSGSRYGLEVRYSFDGDKLLGTGGALRRALPRLGELFWVMYGDSYLDMNYRSVFEAFQRAEPSALLPANVALTPRSLPKTLGLMTVVRNNSKWDQSNAVFRDGKLLCYDKKKPQPEMDYIDYGASLLRRAAVERIPAGTFYDLADLQHELVQRGEMMGYEIHQRFYEIGSRQGLEETASHLEAQQQREGNFSA